MDFEKIKAAAEGYKADMTRFLRAMISHPSESCEEKEVVACIKAEMEKLGYDKVEVDGLGNVIGWMGCLLYTSCRPCSSWLQACPRA